MDKLTKIGDSARLIIGDAKEIKVALKWKGTGLWGRILRGAVDLDLGCFYKLRSGATNLIDCLQYGTEGGPSDQHSRQGCLTDEPWIWHSGDKDGHESLNNEEIIINAEGLPHIELIMIYCYIYDGPAVWDKIDARLEISAQNTISIPIMPSSDHRFVAIAEIGHDLNVKYLGTAHHGHADCDAAYGWGFAYAD